MLKSLVLVFMMILGSVALAAGPNEDKDKDKPLGTIAPTDEKESEKYQKLFKMPDQSGQIHNDEKYLLSYYAGSSGVIADPSDAGIGLQTATTGYQVNLTYKMSPDLSMGGFIGIANFDRDAFFGGFRTTILPIAYQASLHLGPYFYLGGSAGVAFIDINDDTESKVFLGPHLGFRTRTESGFSIGFEAQGLLTFDSDTFTQGNLFLNIGWWL